MKQLTRIGEHTHLVLDGEHVLCHTATSDAADTEKDESVRWHATEVKVVTCPRCVDIIRLCRGVRVSQPARRGS